MGILSRILNGATNTRGGRRGGRPMGRSGGTGGGLLGMLRRGASDPNTRRKAKQAVRGLRNRRR
ncbi:hypothetical protein AB0I45_08245 [Brevibacterium sp. NPDC049920]|uniref:Uncharacterized protein n=1 Tax=Brevibacterium pityocampae TaxID=506594 RepID=A0ABP8J2Y5_9MICO